MLCRDFLTIEFVLWIDTSSNSDKVFQGSGRTAAKSRILF